jgi:AcrR family transcriptional regulator
MSDEPREAVIRATYRALCAHGYANLTMQDIADETDLSKAALHYHYDTKRDLLTAFLDSLTSWYERRLRDLSGDTPPERLASLFDECLSHDDTDYPAFHTAMLEVKAQAPYEAAYRERLTAVDDVLFERVRGIVADGVADGSFEDVDSEATASFVVSVLAGAHTRNVAVGHPLDETRRLLDDYVEAHLLAVEAAVDDGADAEAEATRGRDESDPSAPDRAEAPR